MLLDSHGLCPYVYFRQHYLAQADEQMFTDGQEHCYVLWDQYDGVTTLERGEQSWQLDAGQIFLAGPGVKARWQAKAHVTRVVFDLIPRKRRLSRRKLYIPDPWSPQPPLNELFGHELEGVLPEKQINHARSIITAVGLPNDRINRLQSGAQLIKWLIEMVKGMEMHSQPERTDDSTAWNFIQRAELLLSEQRVPRIRVAEVADRLGVSREYLSRLFKRTRGYGPGRARLLSQIELAKSLLQQDQDNELRNIAYQCGFGNANSLIRAFKDIVGMTPGTWRRQERR